MSVAGREMVATLEALRDKSAQGLEKLQVQVAIEGESLSLYNAGIKNGSVRFGLFARDLLVASLMLRDGTVMSQVIRFVCRTLGREYRRDSGEEPGRAIHEYDRVRMRGLSTRYNAAETSLLLLISGALYLRITGDRALIEEESESFVAAAEYLYSHLDDGFFVEDCSLCGADRYALRATYWKDAGLPGRIDPHYPVTYTLVQAQAVAALRAVTLLTEVLGGPADKEEYAMAAERALERLFGDLWDENLGYPLIAVDRKGPISGVSSDALHMLAYLRSGDVPGDMLNGISANAAKLATPYGYRTYAPGQIDYAPDSYHLGPIWPYEQFFIACGAIIQGLEDLARVAMGTVEALHNLGFPELVVLDGESPSGGGCDTQLWSLVLPSALLRLVCGGDTNPCLEATPASG